MNKKTITRLVITFLFGLIYFYIILPPINLQSYSFLAFLLILSFVLIYLFVPQTEKDISDENETIDRLKNIVKNS